MNSIHTQNIVARNSKFVREVCNGGRLNGCSIFFPVALIL